MCAGLVVLPPGRKKRATRGLRGPVNLVLGYISEASRPNSMPRKSSNSHLAVDIHWCGHGFTLWLQQEHHKSPIIVTYFPDYSQPSDIHHVSKHKGLGYFLVLLRKFVTCALHTIAWLLANLCCYTEITLYIYYQNHFHIDKKVYAWRHHVW